MAEKVDGVGSLRAQLEAQFEDKYIEWRRVDKIFDWGGKKRCKCVPYVEARAIQTRLSDCVGIGGWRAHYVITAVGRRHAMTCQLSLNLGDEWITKEDGCEIEEGGIEPIKAAYSNSLKRAAQQWGIGRYLYDLPDSLFELTTLRSPGDFFIFRDDNRTAWFLPRPHITAQLGIVPGKPGISAPVPPSSPKRREQVYLERVTALRNRPQDQWPEMIPRAKKALQDDKILSDGAKMRVLDAITDLEFELEQSNG